MRYSFTGPVNAAPDVREYVRRVLKTLPDPFEFSSGAAYGIDTICFEEAVRLFPEATHRLLVPLGQPHNSDLRLSAWNAGYEVKSIKGGYMKRNDALVEHCETLVAFPSTATEQLRSGTWATIRRARKAGKQVLIYPLRDVTLS